MTARHHLTTAWPPPPPPTPPAVGPILGPLIGGALAQALGWRSTFVALAIAGALALVAVALFVPVSAGLQGRREGGSC